MIRFIREKTLFFRSRSGIKAGAGFFYMRPAGSSVN